MRFRLGCCLASDERLGKCTETASPSGEDPVVASQLRDGKANAALLAALEQAPSIAYDASDGRLVDAASDAAFHARAATRVR